MPMLRCCPVHSAVSAATELMRAHPGASRMYRLSDVQHCTALQHASSLEHRPVQDEPAPAAGAEPERWHATVEPSQAAQVAISHNNQVKPD